MQFEHATRRRTNYAPLSPAAAALLAGAGTAAAALHAAAARLATAFAARVTTVTANPNSFLHIQYLEYIALHHCFFFSFVFFVFVTPPTIVVTVPAATSVTLPDGTTPG